MQYRVTINLYGHAFVDADSVEDARVKAEALDESDFAFEPFSDEVLDDADICEEDDDVSE